MNIKIPARMHNLLELNGNIIILLSLLIYWRLTCLCCIKHHNHLYKQQDYWSCKKEPKFFWGVVKNHKLLEFSHLHNRPGQLKLNQITDYVPNGG